MSQNCFILLYLTLLLIMSIKNDAVVGKFDFYVNLCPHLCIEAQIQHLSLELMSCQMVSLAVQCLYFVCYIFVKS